MDGQVRLHASFQKFICKKCDRHTASHANVEKCVDEGDTVKSNLKFVQNVPIIYVNFFTIVIAVSEKKKKEIWYRRS